MKKDKVFNDNGELFIRASQIGKIMTKGKKANELSAGAKTYVNEIFKQYSLQYVEELDGNAINKGIQMEELAIEMLSRRYNRDYTKNELTLGDGFVQGTCDILGANYVRDVKCSHTKKTFPLFPEDVKSNLYEWQLRAYMMLYQVDSAYLDYCLLSTPEMLIAEWESESLHIVDHIDEAKRITTVKFQRDLDKEMMMHEKVMQCRKYWKILEDKLINK